MHFSSNVRVFNKNYNFIWHHVNYNFMKNIMLYIKRHLLQVSIILTGKKSWDIKKKITKLHEKINLLFFYLILYLDLKLCCLIDLIFSCRMLRHITSWPKLYSLYSMTYLLMYYFCTIFLIYLKRILRTIAKLMLFVFTYYDI